MSELKCIVCGSKATEKLARVQVQARFDCDICNGTGDQYLSDGVYGSCDCLHDCGPWVKCNVCDYCEHAERISTESITTIGNADDYIEKVISEMAEPRTKTKAANDETT